MRSMTLSHLPGRCQRCWVRQTHCVCPLVPRLETKTHVLIIRHAREAVKSTGTARLAALALPRATLVEYGEDAQPALGQVDELLRPGAALLFPGESLPSPPGAAVTQLVVLDGTWRQARRMLRRLPSVQVLPRLSLPPKEQAVLRLRDAHFAEGRSTLEAIADALALLEGEEEVAPALHALHTAYVERVFRARGVWKLKSQ